MTEGSIPIPMKDLGDYIDQEEADKLMLCPTDKRDRLVIALLWRCGLRAHEIGRLQWKHLDKDGRALIVIGKGKRAGRVPINKRIFKWLIEEEDTDPESYIIEGNSGKGLDRTTVWRIVKKYSELSGILVTKSNRPVHPHSLRHSLAIWLVKMGVPLPKIQQILRHTSLNATTYYLQFSSKELSEDYDNAWAKVEAEA